MEGRGGAKAKIQGDFRCFAFLFLFRSVWLELASTTVESNVIIQIWSTLPVGAGMGSSASYSVALAAALLQAVKPEICGAGNISSVDGEPGSVALRTEANKWAFECERLFHGAPSGIDNTVCSLGTTYLLPPPRSDKK